MGKPHKQKQTAQPRFQPISMLPTLATHIDGMLESDTEQYQTLLEAKPKPYVLDNFTVNRVKEVFSKQREDFPLFEEQLRRWQAGPLTNEQRTEVLRLVEQMRLLRENNANVLALADELAQGTIEKVMGKSSTEIGVEFLQRMMENK